MTSIEWVRDANGNRGETWNPIVGCSKISAGCQNCYAINQAYRNEKIGAAKIAKQENPGRLAYYEGLTEKRGDRVEWTGIVRFVPEALEIPIKTKKATTWFVNSMSDLFHESVQDDWLDQILAVIALTPQHKYQILTKRPHRMRSYMNDKERHGKILLASKQNAHIPSGMYPLAPHWHLPNLWFGVTVENQSTADERIPLLLDTPAALRFISCEPLLEEINLRKITAPGRKIDGLTGQWFSDNETGESVTGGRNNQIDWVIVGGESGHRARPCNINWIDSIVKQCKKAGVPVFVKQLGNKPYLLDLETIASTDVPRQHQVRITGKGNDISEFPEDSRIREMPNV